VTIGFDIFEPIQPKIGLNMIRTFAKSLFVILTLLTLQMVAQEPDRDTWKGTLNAGGAKLRLEIDIKRGDELSGQLRSLDQNNAKMEISEIKLDAKVLAFSIPKVRASFSGELSKEGSIASGVFKQAGKEFKLDLTKSEAIAPDPVVETLQEAWVGELELGVMKPVMQFRVVETEEGETKVYFDSVTEGVTGIPANWIVEGREIKFTAEAIKLVYTGTLNEAGDVSKGTWRQGGREFALTLKKQLSVYTSENKWENRPQKPVAPFPYDAKEVTFKNELANLTLAGTLTIPQKGDKHPAVILISGSGPQDRDETLMEHKPFLVLADYLSRRGIAVLRYDDRGTAKSTGDFGSATTADLATDASAAIEFLSSHPRINSAEIGIVGHSEGGLIAPIVVGMRDDVAFIVLMAGTGVDGKTIIISQSAAMARAEGVDEAEIELSQKVTSQILEIVTGAEFSGDEETLKKMADDIVGTLTDEERQKSEGDVRKGISGAVARLNGKWMNYFLKYDPKPALVKTQCPVLSIIGTNDTQVLCDLNSSAIEAALKEGGNKDFEIVKLDGLNHLFQMSETGGMSEYVTIQETMNPKALKKIGDWITTRTSLKN